MVITGDLQQSDLQYRERHGQTRPATLSPPELVVKRLPVPCAPCHNGLYDFIHKMKLYSYTHILEEIRLVEMNADDVERSPVVRRVLEISEFSKKYPHDIL